MPEAVKFGVIQTGGKQYLVHNGQVIRVEKISTEPGAKLEFTDLVSGKDVKATVMDHGLGPKVRIVKFRPKTRYLRRGGHRQPFTNVRIEEIG